MIPIYRKWLTRSVSNISQALHDEVTMVVSPLGGKKVKVDISWKPINGEVTTFTQNQATFNRLDSFLNYHLGRHQNKSRQYFQRLLAGGLVSVNHSMLSDKNRSSTLHNLLNLKRLLGNKQSPVNLLHIHVQLPHESQPPSEHTPIIPEKLPLNILYEDSDILIINKIANMVVHPPKHGPFIGTVANALLGYHQTNQLPSPLGAEFRPGIIHRLDKDTTGVLVTAVSEDARRWLSSCFADRKIKKQYLCIVEGNLGPPGTVISCDKSIRRHPQHRQRMITVNNNVDNNVNSNSKDKICPSQLIHYPGLSASQTEDSDVDLFVETSDDDDDDNDDAVEIDGEGDNDDKDSGEVMPKKSRKHVKSFQQRARLSFTKFTIMETSNQSNMSLVLAEPITGRTHQIRVHLASLGSPIVGDTVYGQSHSCCSRQLLHAWMIECPYPLHQTEKHLVIYAPLPTDMLQVLSSLRQEKKI